MINPTGIIVSSPTKGRTVDMFSVFVFKVKFIVPNTLWLKLLPGRHHCFSSITCIPGNCTVYAVHHTFEMLISVVFGKLSPLLMKKVTSTKIEKRNHHSSYYWKTLGHCEYYYTLGVKLYKRRK